MRLPSVPKVCRLVAGTILIFTCADHLFRYREYTAVRALAETSAESRVSVPSYSQIRVPFLSTSILQIQKYPWTLITCSLTEESVFGLVTTLALVIGVGRSCERVWSSSQYSIFLGLVFLVPRILTLLLYMVLVIVTGNHEYITSNQSGGAGLVAGFAVAVKQLFPDHTLALFQGRLKFRLKHVILPSLIVYSVLRVVLTNQDASLPTCWFGFYTAWVYLRFYRVTYLEALPSTVQDSTTSSSFKIHGDKSDSFAFADFWFPDLVKQVVATICEFVFDLLVSLGLCLPFDPEEVEAGNSRSASTATDRRKALALKVLQERLAQ